MSNSTFPLTGQAPVLPPDPYDALTLVNDIVGLRLWGPAPQPTLSLGRSDIWDRRWFADGQPLVTLDRLRELAATDRLAEVAAEPNRTIYDLYGRYEFPCPKPAGQVILGCPFATESRARRCDNGVIELAAAGPTGRLEALIWVSLTRSLVVVDCNVTGLQPGQVWIRIWRHRDTVLPGQPVSATLSATESGDFEPLPPPRAFQHAAEFGIVQDFQAETTFSRGFQAAVAATVLGADIRCECVGDTPYLGTPLWAPREGRLDHGVLKRYTPQNEAPGAAATATPTGILSRFTVLVAVATTHDGPDAAAAAVGLLDEARHRGVERLRQEYWDERQRARRQDPATVRVQGELLLSAPDVVLPSLRRAGGYYSDVPLCTVMGTKLWFQDVGLWHNDFHFNEIRAEPMLTMDRAAELLPYCELIHNLLPMAEENARDTYGLPGAQYPLVHFPLRTHGICHVNLTWELDLGLNGLVSKPLWLYFRHTGDREYLCELAWPVLRAGARFCLAYLGEAEDGYLHIDPTVSPEHWGLTPRFERNRDSQSALTLVRYLLGIAARAAQILAKEPAEAAVWRAAIGRLAPFPTFMTDAGPVWVDVAGAPPIEYNVPVPLSCVFWGDDVGLDSPSSVLELARRTLEQIRIWKPHSFYVDACIRNRLGIWREGAVLHPENLLLSYQSIRLFPCVPPTGEIAIRNLAAEGGFLVSATRADDGQVEDVRLLSRLGERCRLANPWPQRPVAVACEQTGTALTATPGQTHLEFATRPGHTYRVLRQ